MDPWDDPALMDLYQVQIETSDIIVGYEIATSEFDHCDIAMDHLREQLVEPFTAMWVGGTDHIGYHPVGESHVVKWDVSAGPDALFKKPPPKSRIWRG